MNILGISAYYSDSAAALIINGEIICAAQEARFSRLKHDSRFPLAAIAFCLKTHNLQLQDIDYIAFYDTPCQLNRGTWNSLSSFKLVLNSWFHHYYQLPNTLRRLRKPHLNLPQRASFKQFERAQSLAAATFYLSGFAKAAILIVDSTDLKPSISIARGHLTKITVEQVLNQNNSLNRLYEAFTNYLGLKTGHPHHKLIDLAGFGRPRYLHKMRHIIIIKKDGSFDLDPMYFSKTGAATRKLAHLFGKQHQIQPYESQHGMDIAASLQVIVEDIMVKLATHALALTENHNLCIAGAYALNTACNTRLRNRLVTSGQLYIQPAPGDAGGAIGAALMTWHHTLNNPRSINMFSPFLGPSFSQEQIKATLIQQNAVAHDYLDPNKLTDTIATALSESKVVGLLTGKAEFGERALGNRCILADASNPKMLEILNLKIKFQESSRALPGCILEEDLETLCDSKIKDPFMLHTHKLKQAQQARNGVQYPAITHANGTARLQTVTLKQCPQLHTVLKAYKRKTGHSVLINTPFNIRGEPMVLTPEDAYRCFMFTNMDILILGHYILFKEEQIGHKQHKAQRSQRSHREADHTLP